MSSTDASAPTPEQIVEEAGRRARQAAPTVATLPTGVKNETLIDLADTLIADVDSILEANECDVRAGERRRMSEADLDRLTFTRQRIWRVAEGVRAVAALPDPIGEVLRGSRRPNGLIVQEVRVPLGVIALIYDDRPNLTIDAISLGLKAGNAVLLLGGPDSMESNKALMKVVARVLDRHNIPSHAVQLIRTSDQRGVERLMHLREYVDVIIPRGSGEFVRNICASASVPTIEIGRGNCHIFVERSARQEMAADIAFNAKVQRPGVANSMEKLLIDRPIAREFLPSVGTRLRAAGVELRGCEGARAILPDIRPATEEDWSKEYQELILAIRIVDDLDEAIAHINRYSTRHSEAIVTEDYFASRRFCERVDAAAVYVNASTRFTSGFEFGLGAELGVSTQKLHRRGPLGLRPLTTWKWIVYGEGQVRD